MNKEQLIVAWVVNRFRWIIGIPDIKKIKEAISEWIIRNPRVTKVHLFGSYIKRNKIIPKDIDIAIEISEEENDTANGFWCGESKKMEKELSEIINYKIHLEWFNGDQTLTIKKGLGEGSVVIYERDTE